MQILRQHKNVYKLYAWARTQESLDAYRIKYEDRVRHWNALRAEGVSLTKCAEFVGISHASQSSISSFSSERTGAYR